MTTWGFIGSGNIGGTVARLALAVDDTVIMSNSRGPASLSALVADLGTGATAGTPEDAATADVVVVTIPLKNYQDVPVAALAGKIVIDTMNYYPGRDGQIAEVEAGMPSSVLFQSTVPDSHVVKGFNNIFFQHLATLASPDGSNRTALPIAGDDAGAVTEVSALLDRIGYDAVPLGDLEQSWRSQPDTPVYGTPYAADPHDWTAGAKVAGVDVISRLVAAAQR